MDELRDIYLCRRVSSGLEPQVTETSFTGSGTTGLGPTIAPSTFVGEVSTVVRPAQMVRADAGEGQQFLSSRPGHRSDRL